MWGWAGCAPCVRRLRTPPNVPFLLHGRPHRPSWLGQGRGQRPSGQRARQAQPSVEEACGIVLSQRQLCPRVARPGKPQRNPSEAQDPREAAGHDGRRTRPGLCLRMCNPKGRPPFVSRAGGVVGSRTGPRPSTSASPTKQGTIGTSGVRCDCENVHLGMSTLT
jgi:hypothetical protein